MKKCTMSLSGKHRFERRLEGGGGPYFEMVPSFFVPSIRVKYGDYSLSDSGYCKWCGLVDDRKVK